MLENNRNAFVGSNPEALFKNSIIDHPSVIQSIKTYFNLPGDLDASMRSGIHGEKADVKLGFTCGHVIDVNIKAYKPSSGFNQLTRASINRFCDIFGINKKNREKLKEIVLNKARNTKLDLFPEPERKYWHSFFEPRVNELIKWGFSYKPSRELYNKPLKFTKGGF